MNREKIRFLIISAVFFLTTFAQLYAIDIISGRVYEGNSGTEPPTASALSGVTITLFGSNNSETIGISIGTTTTNGEGWYGLTATIGYEYYTLVESDPSGYHSVGASSVDGTVLSNNQIRFSTVSAPLSDQTLTGNKFWDQTDTPANNPPVADANGPYTGMVGQSITFDGSGSSDPDPGDMIVSYEWDLDNDGQYDDATGVSVQHTWYSVYNGNIGLRVTDSNGGIDSDQSSVIISRGEPEIDIRGNGISISNGDNTPSNADWTDMGSLEIHTGSITKTFYIHNTGSDTLFLTDIGLNPDTHYQSGSTAASFGLIPDLMKVAPGNSVSLGIEFYPYQTGIWGTTLTIENNDSDEDPFTFYVQGTGSESTSPLYDYGDAPDPTYPTLLSNNGARHQIDPDVYLGAQIDPDPDGQPNSGSSGDDDDGTDDEDGVVIKTSLITASTVNVELTASTAGFINAWVDFDRDGSWGQALEQVFTDTPVTAGINNLALSVPGDAIPGATLARFRFNRGGNLSYEGEAADGEVEDYIVEIDKGASVGASVGDFVWNDLNKNGLQESGEPGIDSVSVMLIYEAGNALATTYTDAFGYYQFTNVAPAAYYIHFVLKPGYDFSPPDVGVDDAIDSDALHGTGETQLFSLIAGDSYPHMDAGMYQSDEMNEFDFGDAPDSPESPEYPTLLANNGARHIIKSDGPWLGGQNDFPDAETNGQQSSNASGDDNDGKDDENGFNVVPMKPIISGSLHEVHVGYTTSDTAYINMWVDFNGNGSWGDTNEHTLIDATVYGPYTILSKYINIPASAKLGNTYARFRISSQNNLSYTGLAGDGEVEDYELVILADSTEDPHENLDFGDAPDSPESPEYPTLLANNGARHIIKPGFYLGTGVDGEPNGLPSALADGDNNNGYNDEDGVSISPFIAPGQAVPLIIVASDTGVINAWLDFNMDGDWADAGEQFITAQPVFPGANSFTFNVPGGSTLGLTYARIRFSSIRQLSYNGLAPDGEVEDYALEIVEGDEGSVTIIKEATPEDNTIFWICSQLNTSFFGLYCDCLQDPLKDTITILNPDKVLSISESSIPNWTLTDITVTGDSDKGSIIDIANRRVDLDYDLGEHIVITFKNKKTVNDNQFDFGDAPDPTYPTLLASNGARHKISPNLYLGSSIDPEPEGQPTLKADGDDQNTLYPGIPFPAGDEEGVLLPSVITAGQSFSIQVTSFGTGVLNAWLDFNIDGDWADAGEHMIPALPLSPGKNTFTITAPGNAQAGQSYARFRLSSVRDISYDGLAPDGEVEDYAIGILQGDGGSITIIKEATPKDDTPFWITTLNGAIGGAAPFRDPSSNTSNITNAPVGTYSIGESIPTGWTLTDIVVTGDSDHGSAIDVGNANAQIDLDAGESITVVFKNTKTGEDNEYDFGDAPSPFPTKLADLGPYHLIDTTFKFGKFIDAESDGLPDATAQGDDKDNLDDESEMIYTPGLLYFPSTLNLPADSAVKILFAIDWERDSSWNNNFYVYTIFNSAPSPIVLDLSAFGWYGPLQPGIYNARWRCYQDPNFIASPTGYGGVGEVEDCQFEVTGDEDVEYDYGDAPLPYPTQIQGPPINTYGGRHPVVDGIHLGQTADTEADGQPSPDASGDDGDGSDDEDGIVFTSNLIPGHLVSLDVTASVEGYLNGYIDLNHDQDWDDPNEQIFFEKPLAAGINGLSFTLPSDAQSGASFARFRFSTQKLYMSFPQQNVFIAIDGEVEDYEIFIDEGGEGPPIKWKQAPLKTEDPDSPFAPYFMGWDEYSVYKEKIVADDWFCNDPRPVTDIHWWGSYFEWDNVAAPEHAPYEFHIGVWTDAEATDHLPWRHPGELVWEWRVPREMLNERPVGDDFVPGRMEKPDTCFQYDFMIPEDQWFFQEGDSTIYWLSIAAVYEVVPDSFVWGWKTREHYFHSDAVRITEPKEFGIGTRVESAEPMDELWDVAFVLTTNEYSTEFDFGDAPDSRYPTLFAQNGAHHIFTPDVFLGAGVDPEVDGQPEQASQGDDLDGNDDEDGIIFLSKLKPGSPVSVEVNASTSGFLNAWMDFNNNGSWAEPDEQIFIDQALVPGTNVLTFTMPLNSFEALTFSRFRFSREAHIPFFGLAMDGEVEDYYVDVNPVGIDDTKELERTEFKLMQNFPNPFNSTTEILYEIPREVFVRLSIYDLTGKEIAILVNEQKSPGRHTAIWKGKDHQGQEATEGIYFYRFEAGNFKETRKLLRLKK